MIRTALHVTRCCVLCLALVLSAAGASANSQDLSLREYVQTTWTHRNGLPLATLNSLTQTSDGYLWFTVERSQFLVRFDGVQFTTVPVPCERVHSLAAGLDGSLWLTCRGTPTRLLTRRASGEIVDVPLGSDFTEEDASVFIDHTGRLWLWGDSAMRREPDGSLRTLASLHNQGFATFAEDGTGAIWFSDSAHVTRIDGDETETMALPHLALSRARSGDIMAARADAIYRIEGRSLALVARAPDGVEFAGRQVADSTGAIWAATQQHGIARVHKGRVETLLAAGDPGGAVNAVFLDREENIWVGSSSGLHRFRKPYARLLPSVVGQMHSRPQMVFADSRDNVWVAGVTPGAVRINLTNGARRFYDGIELLALAEDREGRTWLGTSDALYRLEGDSLRPVRDASGGALENVSQFQTDANGNLLGLVLYDGIYQLTPGPPRRIFQDPNTSSDFLISTRQGTWVSLRRGQGVLQRRPDGTSIRHQVADGDAGGSLLAIVESSDSVWVGHYDGLSRWRNGQWTRWTDQHGLPSGGGVQEIINDGRGRLWLMTYGGIVALRAADLEATPDGQPSPLRFVHIGALDRVVAHPGTLIKTPRASMDRRGRIYFATYDTVAVVDPDELTDSSLRPTIVLEAASVDNRAIDLASVAWFSAPSKLQFDYTSLSLRSPETIRFRYRLEGYDSEWVEAGGRRQALYGTLPPGSYHFKVIGSGSDGVWNDEGASYAFEIVPLFYNTWWFRTMALLSVACMIVATHRLRVRRLTNRMQLQFEARLAERTRIAQELHDTLLQGTLAASLHAQLAEQALQAAPPSPALEKVRSPLKQTMDLLSDVARESRAVLGGLRSASASIDIAQMLHQAAGEQSNHRDIEFRVAVDGTARPLTAARGRRCDPDRQGGGRQRVPACRRSPRRSRARVHARQLPMHRARRRLRHRGERARTRP